MNLNKFECMAKCRVGQPSKCRKVFKPGDSTQLKSSQWHATLTAGKAASGERTAIWTGWKEAKASY